MKRVGLTCIAFLISLGFLTGANANETSQDAFVPETRQMLIRKNMILDNEVAEALELIQRAAKAGYTDIILGDTKTNTWFTAGFKDKYQTSIQTLYTEAKRLGLNFYVNLLPYGYCTSVLAHDPNLAEGVPVKNAPMQVVSGKLEPISTAELVNPSFESFVENELAGWSFRDKPSEVSFIDTSVAKEGTASIRLQNFSAHEFGLGRVIQEFEVEPFKQYQLSVWLKAEAFTGKFDAIIKTETERSLLSQDFVLTGGDRVKAFKQVSDLTLDWTKFSWTFNSLNHDKVKLILGVFAGQSGTVWLDDFELKDAPTLNVLRRDDLPLQLRRDGTRLIEGQDFLPVQDDRLGIIPYAGKYSTAHEPPVIELAETSSLADGDILYYSSYNALPVQGGQLTCSMTNERMFELAETIVEQAATLDSDGFLLGHSELRVGGFEPAAETFKTTGTLFGNAVKRHYDFFSKHAEGKPVYMWSDLLDPYHNAREFYYQVNGDLAESWVDVPRDITLITWWESEKIDKNGANSLNFLAQQGFKQIIGGYYNEKVETNYNRWQAALKGIDGIEGVMFATWTDDYRDLERFAEVWWGEAEE